MESVWLLAAPYVLMYYVFTLLLTTFKYVTQSLHPWPLPQHTITNTFLYIVIPVRVYADAVQVSTPQRIPRLLYSQQPQV